MYSTSIEITEMGMGSSPSIDDVANSSDFILFAPTSVRPEITNVSPSGREKMGSFRKDNGAVCSLSDFRTFPKWKLQNRADYPSHISLPSRFILFSPSPADKFIRGDKGINLCKNKILHNISVSIARFISRFAMPQRFIKFYFLLESWIAE